jgi:hypothetical protein
MNRTELYYKAIELKNQGKKASEISIELSVPRRTISGWLLGKSDPSKMKKKTGVYKTTDEEFISAIKNSQSISQALLTLNLEAKGGNYKVFHKRAKNLNCDLSHFTGQGHLKNKTHNWAKETPIEEAFVSGGGLSTSNLKKKILKYNLKPYHCDKCSISLWLDKPLSLHLDHINGCNTDNRLENLRFLCPNCHSQTETYCGKSKKKW